MINWKAEIIDKKLSRLSILSWFLFYVCLFFLFSLTIGFFYSAWNITGLVIGFILLPFTVIACPFVILVLDLAPILTTIIYFVILIITTIFLLNVWTIATQKHILKIPKSKVLIFTRFRELFKAYIWILQFWIEFWVYGILIFISPIFILFGPLRQLVFTLSLKNSIWASDHPGFFSIVLVVAYFQIAIGIPALVYQFIGNEKLFEGIALAVALLVFLALQLQKMTPPFFVSSFCSPDGKRLEKKHFRMAVQPDSVVWLFISVTNLGLTTFKDCTFKITFPAEIRVIDDFDQYVSTPFYKNYILRGNCTIVEFLPNNNYLTFPPLGQLIFPILIHTPEIECKKYRIVTSLSTESAWGEEQEPLSIETERKSQEETTTPVILTQNRQPKLSTWLKSTITITKNGFNILCNRIVVLIKQIKHLISILSHRMFSRQKHS
jgi:hypothetical protein